MIGPMEGKSYIGPILSVRLGSLNQILLIDQLKPKKPVPFSSERLDLSSLCVILCNYEMERFDLSAENKLGP